MKNLLNRAVFAATVLGVSTLAARPQMPRNPKFSVFSSLDHMSRPLRPRARAIPQPPTSPRNRCSSSNGPIAPAPK
jgi:hypothetical protein